MNKFVICCSLWSDGPIAVVFELIKTCIGYKNCEHIIKVQGSTADWLWRLSLFCVFPCHYVHMCRTSHNSSCSKRNDHNWRIYLFVFLFEWWEVHSYQYVSFISQLSGLEFLLSLVKFLLLDGSSRRQAVTSHASWCTAGQWSLAFSPQFGVQVGAMLPQGGDKACRTAAPAILNSAWFGFILLSHGSHALP